MNAPQRGYLLQFASAQDLLNAVDTLVGRGYQRLEAYSPVPLPALHDKLPPVRNLVAALMLLGGVLGGALGYGIQYYTAVIDYPLLVGGKPPHSWPAFLPVTFAFAALGAALTGFLSALWGSGLPRLHHPLFEVAAFTQPGRNRFFLLIDAGDPACVQGRGQRELECLPGPIATIHLA